MSGTAFMPMVYVCERDLGKKSTYPDSLVSRRVTDKIYTLHAIDWYLVRWMTSGGTHARTQDNKCDDESALVGLWSWLSSP